MRNPPLIAAFLAVLALGLQVEANLYRVKPDGEVWKAQPVDFNVKVNCQISATHLEVELLVQYFGSKTLSFDPAKIVDGAGAKSAGVEYRVLKADSVRLDAPMAKATGQEPVELAPGAIFEGQYDFDLQEKEPEQVRVTVKGFDGISKTFPAVCVKDKDRD